MPEQCETILEAREPGYRRTPLVSLTARQESLAEEEVMS
jgi:hypothetical protein